jgi:hypothetical protein
MIFIGGATNQPVATAYGKNVCTVICKPAPYCGDKAVNGAWNLGGPAFLQRGIQPY